MADDFVKNLLKQWNLGFLISNFEQNAINKHVFLNLNEKLIEKLIPVLGHQFMFSQKYAKYKEEIEVQKLDLSDTVLHESDIMGMPIEIKDVVHISPEPYLVVATTQSNADLPAPNENAKSIINDNDVEREHFLELLNSNFSGRLVVAIYEQTHKVNTALLAEALIKPAILLSSNYKINKQQFEDFTKKIVLAFPTQDRGIYYSSVQSKGPGSPVNISGVLYNHYCHCRKLLKTAGLLTKDDSNKNKRNSLIESENNTEENDSIEKTLEWLQTNTTGTLEEHLEKWESIFAARSLLDDMSIEQMLRKFKYLQNSSGYILLQSDFNRIYPEERDKFIEEWPKIAECIITLAKNDKKNRDVKNYLLENSKFLDNGHSSLVALMLLPLMLGSIGCKTKRGKPSWRPTRKEVQDGFLLHIQTYEEFEPLQESKEAKYKKFDLTIQPYPMICGDLDNIVTCRIFINNQVYVLSDPLETVNCCFKIYFVLNADYPPECKHVWTFLQKFVYKIEIKDKTNSYISVDSLIRDVKVLM
ncbi:uncharacterized protein LOC112452371 [Temnothorax curvispinosus]|uniref:Uncharacterized protein LOC112452371 n=1 Tax=Temnothorax curvispinosus TaxID=300111 RepID=A0A6J1PFY7_9HYME|nr:uncharacterized protein LOC112452371 [Temnothorax curvispinosus]